MAAALFYNGLFMICGSLLKGVFGKEWVEQTKVQNPELFRKNQCTFFLIILVGMVIGATVINYLKIYLAGTSLIALCFGLWSRKARGAGSVFSTICLILSAVGFMSGLLSLTGVIRF